MDSHTYIRQASHAGSWYSNNKTSLNSEISNYINIASSELQSKGANTRAVIVPHAGYRFSAPTAAYSFYTLFNSDQVNIKRIFVLGPSHHKYTNKCEVSKYNFWDTPLGKVEVDTELCKYLVTNEKTKQLFSYMPAEDDLTEHSLEMEIPFIAYYNNIKQLGIKIVPIMVGSFQPSSEELCGSLLSDYLSDETNAFVLSSDFCHWGYRFGYDYYDPSAGQIYQSIEKLDKMGCDAISTLIPNAFTQYLKKYENTICGRHPISVFLNILEKSGLKDKFSSSLLHYDQSNKVTKKNDGSVSYAALAFYHSK